MDEDECESLPVVEHTPYIRNGNWRHSDIHSNKQAAQFRSGLRTQDSASAGKALPFLEGRGSEGKRRKEA